MLFTDSLRKKVFAPPVKKPITIISRTVADLPQRTFLCDICQHTEPSALKLAIHVGSFHKNQTGKP
jgi:hypothetical protein